MKRISASPSGARSGGSRTVTAAFFLDHLGQGLWAPAAAAYFTRVVGLPFGQVAAGLTVAALAALPAGPLVGRAADRYGARNIGVLVLGVQSAATLLLLQVATLLGFVLGTAAVACGAYGVRAVRGALLAEVGEEHKAAPRAGVHARANVAVVLGAAGAGVVLQNDTRSAYLLLIAVNGLCFALACLLVALLPLASPMQEALRATRTPGLPRTSGGAPRDAPLVCAALLLAVLRSAEVLVCAVLPLWIVERTGVPKWTVALLFAVNCALVAALRVRAARAARSPAQGEGTLRKGALATAVGRVLFPATPRALAPTGGARP